MTGSLRFTRKLDRRDDHDATGEAQIIPFRCRSRHSGRPDPLAAVLTRFMSDCVVDEARGPHLVIARGAIDRYYGPFDSWAEAEEVASAEAAEWAREFPGSAVTFHVAPLVNARELARVRS